MIFRNPFKGLTKFEWFLWLSSIVIIGTTSFLSNQFYFFSMFASWVGVTALIFVARGDVWGQIMTVIFSLLYAFVSLRFRYYGEIITYLGMTAPIAAISVVTWMKHPYSGTHEVKIHVLEIKQRIWLYVVTVLITAVFYFILKAINTPNLIVSTVSIATSFLASTLMLFRSPNYALAFAANDIVLILLWINASLSDLSYLPMIACFVMFFINDIYGYVSWVERKKRQEYQSDM